MQGDLQDVPRHKLGLLRSDAKAAIITASATIAAFTTIGPTFGASTIGTTLATNGASHAGDSALAAIRPNATRSQNCQHLQAAA